RSGEAVETTGVFVGDAELGLLVAGRRVVVRRRRLDVGIHAQRNRCALAERLRQLRERAQLALALDVEAVDAGVERGRQLGHRLPYSAEDDLLGGDAGQPGAVQLARTDDVRARAQAAQQPEHREVAVRLDGVGDQAVERRKG